MKTIIYLCCLAAAYFGGGALVGSLAIPLTHIFIKSTVTFIAMQKVLGLLAAFVPLLVLYRLLVFVKSRSLKIPESFRGGPFIVACIATIPSLVVLLGYGYLILSQKVGVSGIPLAFVLASTGLLSVIPVLYCETKEFYSHIPGRKT